MYKTHRWELLKNSMKICGKCQQEEFLKPFLIFLHTHTKKQPENIIHVEIIHWTKSGNTKQNQTFLCRIEYKNVVLNQKEKFIPELLLALTLVIFIIFYFWN